MGRKNPESELTTEQRKVLSSTCLKMVDKGSYALSDCGSLPIFIPGSDVSTATKHDEKAITETPAWVKLNYESGAVKKANGEKRANETSPGCPEEKPAESSCDEYPFFASVQGGSTHSPSLEWINAKDNSLEGTRYGTFLEKCTIAEHEAFLVVPTQAVATTWLCNK